jgi:Na+/phosphate symporter
MKLERLIYELNCKKTCLEKAIIEQKQHAIDQFTKEVELYTSAIANYNNTLSANEIEIVKNTIKALTNLLNKGEKK